LNLTNLSIKINEFNENQGSDRGKTSLSNLQSYFMQRGINNETNLSNSNGMSQHAAIFNPSAPINIRNFLPMHTNNSVINDPVSPPMPVARENNSVCLSSPGGPVMHHNFYPHQSRLSQKSAIIDLNSVI
jgi:hypothetical protein